MSRLDPNLVRLAQGPNFAAVTTLMPDGQPQTQLMWVDCDDQYLLVNTEVARRKFRNIERDPRITVTIWDRDDPYFYIETRGRVTATIGEPRARAHIDELCQRYLGHNYDPSFINSERVMLLITPERVVSR